MTKKINKMLANVIYLSIREYLIDVCGCKVNKRGMIHIAIPGVDIIEISTMSLSWYLRKIHEQRGIGEIKDGTKSHSSYRFCLRFLEKEVRRWALDSAKAGRALTIHDIDKGA